MMSLCLPSEPAGRHKRRRRGGIHDHASLPSATDLPISLAVDKGEGYVDAANLGEKQVILDAGQTAVNYVIATVDDNVHGADAQ